MYGNSDFIKKYNLEESVKKLQKINEYTFYNSTMVEDDQDPNTEQQQQFQQPQMGGQQIPQGQGTMGDEMPQMDASQSMGNEMQGGEPDIMGGDMQQMGNGQPISPMGGEEPNNMNGDVSPIDSSEGDFGTEDDIEDIEMDTEQPGDEVIDVDELTQSQETTEFKIDDVDDKLNKVLQIISKFNDAIEANDQKIEDLKNEFAKRNPTAEETLNLRSLASYPYSEHPDKYWKKQQEEHPNYKVISDNDVSTADEQKEFEIRKSDIDNFNEREIMKSLGENQIKLSDFIDF